MDRKLVSVLVVLPLILAALPLSVSAESQLNGRRISSGTKMNAQDVPFTDITQSAGLYSKTFDHIAWGDYNNDGYDDMLLSGWALYRNNGNETFTDVTAQAGLNAPGPLAGVWGDYDNDGWLDIYAITYGIYISDSWRSTPHWDVLYHNNGDGTFTNVTAQAGNVYDLLNSQGVAWGDFNNDGYIDLYVANYEQGDTTQLMAMGSPDTLWMNNGDGTFTNATETSGIKATNIQESTWCGRGVNCCDFDDDGNLDIYVSNYRLSPNFLWHNDGTGHFTDVAAAKGGLQGVYHGAGWAYGHSIGSDWADFNNDGNFDLFVGNLCHWPATQDISKYYVNNGPPNYMFTDVDIQTIGMQYDETHSNPSWADYDNDGDLDLYLTCVYTAKSAYLYRNDGGTYTDVAGMMNAKAMNGWGCAWADFNNDGFMDLFVGTWEQNQGKPYYGCHLYRNNGNANHWLGVKLVGADCNRAAIGAKIVVTEGTHKQIRQVEGGSGTSSQDSLIQHFGFGLNPQDTVNIEVKWPCGNVENITNVPIDQPITIKEYLGLVGEFKAGLHSAVVILAGIGFIAAFIAVRKKSGK